jgi:hypothetical protein
MSLASIDTSTVGIPIRVMVLADVRLHREGLARLLGADESIVLAGASPIDGNALERIVAARPDVVLLEGPAACETTAGVSERSTGTAPAPD